MGMDEEWDGIEQRRKGGSYFVLFLLFLCGLNGKEEVRESTCVMGLIGGDRRVRRGRGGNHPSRLMIIVRFDHGHTMHWLIQFALHLQWQWPSILEQGRLDADHFNLVCVRHPSVRSI